MPLVESHDQKKTYKIGDVVTYQGEYYIRRLGQWDMITKERLLKTVPNILFNKDM